MALTNKQLQYYDSEVLRLPADKRSEYHAQVDRLVSALTTALADDETVEVTRVMKAGSFAKHTILRRTTVDPVDVDVVFYISEPDADHETLQEVNDKIYDLLVAQYPTKAVEDFEIQRRTAKVVFVGSGLTVEIVPVVEDPSRAGYGWQFDLSDGSKVETCAPGQIRFVRDRKARDTHFRTLVRLAKRWRNHAGLDHFKSFAVELVIARVLDVDGTGRSIEQRFMDFLLYVAQSEMKEVISFPENDLPLGDFPDSAVVVLDPVSSRNNVTARLTDAERTEIVHAAQAAWETAQFASSADDVGAWKEIFGPRFRTEDR